MFSLPQITNNKSNKQQNKVFINNNRLLICVHIQLLFMLGSKSNIWMNVIDYQSWTFLK